jgi:hypothetical protein
MINCFRLPLRTAAEQTVEGSHSGDGACYRSRNQVWKGLSKDETSSISRKICCTGSSRRALGHRLWSYIEQFHPPENLILRSMTQVTMEYSRFGKQQWRCERNINDVRKWNGVKTDMRDHQSWNSSSLYI